MEEDILKYSSIVMFRGTPCLLKLGNLKKTPLHHYNPQ